jgi:hypothetical protein
VSPDVEPDEPDPIEPLEPVEPDEPVELPPTLPELEPEPLPVDEPVSGDDPPIEPEDPVEEPEPVAPAPSTSMRVTWTRDFDGEPERLARTSSPSWIDESEASWPSFITFVFLSTRSFLSEPDSVSVLLERSNFSTRPWIWLLLLAPSRVDDEEP